MGEDFDLDDARRIHRRLLRDSDSDNSGDGADERV